MKIQNLRHNNIITVTVRESRGTQIWQNVTGLRQLPRVYFQASSKCCYCSVHIHIHSMDPKVFHMDGRMWSKI